MDMIWSVLCLGILAVSAAELSSLRVKRTRYQHCSLPPGGNKIRLLRLIPCGDKSTIVECQLLNYSLESAKGMHLYEALSYVWGDPKATEIIIIDKRLFYVTRNLHAALVRLRDDSLERIVWVDAICINQADEREKENQIRLMSKIYGHATSVLVWLGQADNAHEHDSDQALEDIRAIADRGRTNLPVDRLMQQNILRLLQRPWFRRIWVLQEVAAARHLLIMSGFAEVNGQAFCTGLQSLETLCNSRADLHSRIQSVTYLMSGATFRSRHFWSGLETESLNICPLSDLIDMVHSHEASRRHDKVYALLGMASDDLSTAGILPNYSLPWEELLKRLVEFLIGAQVSVKTWANREMTVIDSTACILGRVISAERVQNDKQVVNLYHRVTAGRQGRKSYNVYWTLPVSVKRVRKGDIVCLLKGAWKPTIIRPCKDHFSIIMIATSPVEEINKPGSVGVIELLQSITLFPRDLLLVWDWEDSAQESHDVREYETVIRRERSVPDSSTKTAEKRLDKATRMWKVAMILEDVEEYEKSEEISRQVTKTYMAVFGETKLNRPITDHCFQTPILWAMEFGHIAALELIFIRYGVKHDVEDGHGRTPLSMAAQNGQDAVVKLLLDTVKVDADLKDTQGNTPLSLAAEYGHEAVVKLLLDTGKVDADFKDKYRNTPLSLAARNGYEAVVKLLLDTGKVDADLKDTQGNTPLSWAAGHGHEAVVKLLKSYSCLP